MRRSRTGSLPSSSCDAFLPAPSHTAPGPKSFPASPRVFPQKRKTDARPAVILGLQGSLPDPLDPPAKTEKFCACSIGPGFPEQPAEPAGLAEPPRLRGLRRTKHTGRAATAAAQSGRVFGASYGARFSGTAGVAGGGARADPKSYPRPARSERACAHACAALPSMQESRPACQTGSVIVTHGPRQRQAADCCDRLPWTAMS
jgi:hypothetical protein